MINNMLSNLKIARSLLRTPTFLLLILYLVIGFLAGLYMSGQKFDELNALVTIGVEFAVCCLIIALWYIFGSGLNDYADYEIDLINLPNADDRPLVSGAADKPKLLKVSLLAGILALVLAATLSLQNLLLVIAVLLLSVSYSLPPLNISRRGGLAPLLLPLGYIVFPFGLGILLTNNSSISKMMVLLIISFYFHFMGRIILKDYRDIKGDKANGKMTFLLRHGNRNVCLVSGISISIATVILLVALNPFISIFRLGFIYLLFFGLVTLNEVSKAKTWKKQKPLLASFGRAMTGITALTILALCNAIWRFDNIEQLVLLIALLGVYTWSAQQALRYNSTN